MTRITFSGSRFTFSPEYVAEMGGPIVGHIAHVIDHAALDRANHVIERAFAADKPDEDLIAACERVIHSLSTGEPRAMVGDYMMVEEADD